MGAAAVVVCFMVEFGSTFVGQLECMGFLRLL